MAGSPLRLFRTTAAGAAVIDQLDRAADIERSHLVDRLLDTGAIHPIPPDAGTPLFRADDVTVVTPQYGPIGTAADRGAWRAHADGRITIDDGSTPPLTGATMRLPDNRGPAAARNAVRPLITTPLVAFLDADVTVGRDHAAWLAPLLWHFDDPHVGLVAPRVTGEAGSPLDLGPEPGRIRAGTRISYVPGAALIVRVTALDEIGWFDEGLRVGEDVDLVWRLDQAGWRCRYDPSVEVRHEPRSTWLARLRQHAAYGASAAPLSLRHRRALAPLDVNGWTLAAWTMAVGGHVITGAGVAIGTATALPSRLPGVPRSASFALAMHGHLAAGVQIARTMRRTWWPLLAVGAVVSRRVRRLALVALALDVRAVPTDLAYGWGVWRGMRRHRTVAPIVPRVTPWPPRHRDLRMSTRFRVGADTDTARPR